MFCPKCGTQVTENDRFCPTCGEPMGVAEKPVRETDHTEMFSEEDRERTRFLSALCYLNFLFAIIGLLVEPNSKFLRYHLNQSLVLTIFSLLCGVVAIIPVLGWIASGIGAIAVLVFMIMGIVRAVNREAKDLPIIGKYKIVYYD